MAIPPSAQPSRIRSGGGALLHGALACSVSLVLHALGFWWLAGAWPRSPQPASTSVRVELVLQGSAAAASVPATPVAPAPTTAIPEPASAPVAPAVAQPVPVPSAPVAVAKTSLRAPAVAAQVRGATATDPAAGAQRDLTAAREQVPAMATAVTAPPRVRAAQNEAVPSATADSGAAQKRSQRLAMEWRVQQWLAQFRKYPRAAARAGYQGTVLVRFVLDRDGSLRTSELVDSSGHQLLDRAALELLDRASPFPPLPGSADADEIELVLPIDYRLHAGISG